MATGSLGQQNFIPTTTSPILILLVTGSQPSQSFFTVDATGRKRKQSMNIKLYLGDEKFYMLDQQHKKKKSPQKKMRATVNCQI